MPEHSLRALIGRLAVCLLLIAPLLGAGQAAAAPAGADPAVRVLTLSDERADAVIVLQTSMLLTYSGQIAALALEKRLPTVHGYREHVVAGGLISYGVDLRWCFYRGAYFVAKGCKTGRSADCSVHEIRIRHQSQNR